MYINIHIYIQINRHDVINQIPNIGTPATKHVQLLMLVWCQGSPREGDGKGFQSAESQTSGVSIIIGGIQNRLIYKGKSHLEMAENWG